ncbi:MAG: phage portal protein [Pseudomonadota bacterium]
MNILDRTIAAVAPRLGLQRAVARRVLADMSYDAASTGRRTAGWRSGSSGPAATVSEARNRVRYRGRELVRNNPIAKKAVMVISQNVVGRGILPNTICKVASRKTKVEGLLKAHFDTTACDFYGRANLYGLQRQIISCMVTDGEVFVLRHMNEAFAARGKSNGPQMPLQYQILSADYLDVTKRSLSPSTNGETVFDGVVYDRAGRVRGYWFYDRHPNDTLNVRRLESNFYPVERVSHIFRSDMAGQLNGISWFAPVMVKMHDLKDFSDFRLLREKNASSFAYFVHSNSEAGLGMKARKGDGEDYVSSYPITDVPAGSAVHLRDGDQVTAGLPPQVEGYGEYWGTNALEIAMGLGLSYATLTGDLSKGNFSSSRMGWLEDQRFFEATRDDTLQPKFLDRVNADTQLAAQFSGVRGEFSLGWTPPARDMVDPVRETNANIAAMEAGIKSRAEAVRERGRDVEDVDDERAEDAARERNLMGG